MPLPIFGRLSLADWQRLVITFMILTVEQMLRMLAFLTPVSLIDWFRFHVVSNVYPRIFRGYRDEEIKEERNPFVGAKNTVELVEAQYFIEFIPSVQTPASGYRVEEHNVFTPDGYLLVLHRILSRETTAQVNGHRARYARPTTNSKPPVLMIHGCMMSSEVWVCLRSSKKCLPFVLVDAGYDVWLGNNRGNKYCQKHRTLKASQGQFWDFSLDEMVMHDLPAMVDHVLAESPGYTNLTYVGFSQGSTIAFACLSQRKDMNEKIGLMIGLSATTKPKGMQNRLVQALTRASPELVYLFFSRTVFIKLVAFWKELFSARAYTAAIDMFLAALFGWEGSHMRFMDKLIAYQHLYAFTSSKSIVHWFQIMRAKRFQMYDDGSLVTLGEGHVVPRYTLEAISTKIALFLGDKDTLVDNEYTKNHLGTSVIHLTEVAEYEHLDFLWAQDLDTRIYPQILQLLKAKHE